MPLPAKTIQDCYEVLEEIARGGMAQVYKARQLSLGRIVAVKEIKSAFAANPELVERFKREARTAANLVHENIVQVYNFGEPPGGPLFIVMEYVDGMDLKTILARAGAVPPRIGAIIGREVGRALAYAHALGLVHRDVKPANIMISFRGEVKLMDFGIVRELDSELTKTGAFLGTPSYMSPEQFLGEEITAATDLFSLGIVLYEILAGQKPFKADSEASLSKKVRTEKEPKLRSLNPEVPRRLQKIVHLCLVKDPRRRAASAEQLARELEKLVGAQGREEDRRELAQWLAEEVSEAREAMSVSAVPIERPRASLATGARPAPPLAAREKAADKSRPGEPSSLEWQPEASEVKPPPKPSPPPRPPRREPEPRPERTQTLESSEDSLLRAPEGPALSAGEWLFKWMFRLILIAIAILAAFIVFILFSPDQARYLDFSGITDLLRYLHLLR